MKTVRLKDIAEQTGLSVSTVSRILSGDTNRKMKDETINLVLQKAHELGYYNAKKQKLRQALPTLHLICLFVSDHEAMSPFFQEIQKGIKKEVSDLQRHMRLEFDSLSIYDDDFQSRIEKNDIDVAIMIGRVREDMLSFLQEHIPYIMYAGLNSVSGFDEVLCDAREGIREAVTYLRKKGLEKISYIGPTSIQNEVKNEFRYMGYLEGLAENRITLDDNLVEDTYLSSSDGYVAAEKLLQRVHPDAIICANDSVAIGVLRSMKEKGIRCPEDCALIGFDNLEVSAYMEPSLSTFDVPKKDLGRFAVKFAIDRIENPREGNIKITLPYHFIERESTRGEKL